MKLSVVLTILNEERNISDFLDTMIVQEQPLEIIVVDAGSRDRTQKIVRRYSERYPFIKLLVKGGTRGKSRNYGVSVAEGEVIAFIDGDTIANPFWASEIRKSMRAGADIVAGKVINIGLKAWEDLERVELYHKGYDISFPTCNLTYRKEVLEDIKGFDDWFVTAEDIDMNYRAVEAGYKLTYNPKCIVYHRTRGDIYGFFRQAFWNGAGRKQLTLKHGRLWDSYDPLRMFRQQVNSWSLLRLACAITGYLGFKLFGDRGPYD
ncbi:MAG: glycosyltransferase [Methanomassiliicoccales archaeon]